MKPLDGQLGSGGEEASQVVTVVAKATNEVRKDAFGNELFASYPDMIIAQRRSQAIALLLLSLETLKQHKTNFGDNRPH